jgi:hypothetical protein
MPAVMLLELLALGQCYWSLDTRIADASGWLLRLRVACGKDVLSADCKHVGPPFEYEWSVLQVRECSTKGTSFPCKALTQSC